MKRCRWKRCLCALLALTLCCTISLSGTATADPEQDPAARFTDVKPGVWYTEAVREAVSLGFFVGETETIFGTKHAMSRGMLVTVLWQMAGRPAAEGSIPFEDVNSGSYYIDALRWAAGCGVVSGVSPTQFAPRRKVTREQLAVMLLSFARWAGRGTEAQSSLAVYPDASNASGYAGKALAWAVAEGLLSGSDQNGISYLLPGKSTT